VLRTYFASLLRMTSLIILLALAVASVVLWLFGSALTVSGVAPFESATARGYTILGLFIAYFLITFLRHALARHANSKLINSMLANDELVSMGSDLSSDEIAIIRERFEQTLKTLRDTPIDGRRRKTYLFELPWYVIIGPPGTGKTTILQNSGLEFPLATEGQIALQGVGGTRNCDWWIANEAVLIDTAGRYTTQDVNQGIDAATWGGFLQLLKEHRRRRPINGILLAISVADVALAGEEERTRQAEILRQRLRELHRAFEMRLPVYVLFTKCDLIAGFEEFFDDAEEDERNQVWGITFPYDSTQTAFGPAFEEGFVDLVARLERRLPVKLAAERNNARRCRIYSFPHEFGSLSTVLRGFVSDVFRSSRYEAQPQLRGIYFTSGTQEGTPFDRLLGAMSRSFSLAPSQQPAMSGQGKAFFIKRLLTDIVFAEQNIVGKNAKLERRLAAMYSAGYAAVAVVVLALSAYWLFGLESSMETVAAVREDAQRLEVRLDEADRDRSLTNILPALNAARDLQQAAAMPPGWQYLNFMSIDARPALSPAATAAYDGVLGTYLLPSLVARLRSQVQLLSSASDPDSLQLRQLLQTYLMLTTGENYNRSQVQADFKEQAESVFPLNPDDRAQMVGHMDRLANLLPTKTATDAGVVQAARVRLNQVPQATDIYDRMRVDSVQRYQLPPLSLVNALGSSVLRVDTTNPDASTIVPGFYTRDGFYNFFLTRLAQYIRESTGSDWVLGKQGLANETYNQIARQIVDLYTRDYIAAWRGAVDQVRVIEFDNLGRAQTILQVLSNPQSPLTKLLQMLRDNTNLPLPSQKQDGQGNQVAGALPGGTGLIGSAAGSAAQVLEKNAIAAALGDMPWPGTTITDAFLPLTQLVDPQNGQSALTRVQQLFGDLFGTVSGITTAPQPSAAAFSFVSQRAKNPIDDSFAKLRAEAATQPEPVRTMVLSVASRTWQILLTLSYDHVNRLWQQDVVPICNAVLTDRYPFTPSSSEDVALQDFADIFKPAGIIDSFFTDNLTPFINVQGRQLVAVRLKDSSIGISNNTLLQLSRARTIRDAFFGATGTTPEVRFTVEPTFLSPQALKSTFMLDDESIVYRHGPVRAQDFSWPSKLDASTARLRITLLDGTFDSLERTGTWAIFRLLSASGLSNARGQDQFGFSIEQNEARAGFRLKANSVTNPFNLGLYSSFRCPPAL